MTKFLELYTLLINLIEKIRNAKVLHLGNRLTLGVPPSTLLMVRLTLGVLDGDDAAGTT